MLYVQPASLQFNAPNASGQASAPGQASATGQADPAREQEALKELEHFFLYTLLGEMRKTVDDGGLFETGGAMDVFEDLMDDAMAEQMADSGQMGIAKAIADQLHAADIQRSLVPSSISTSLSALG